MVWLDEGWDDTAGFVRSTEFGADAEPHGSVRSTAWYALGLLLRNAQDDAARGVRAIESVLASQYDSPGAPYHGTFRRSPNERPAGAHAVVWRDYDPNWREFIGTALALVLLEYESRLPAPLTSRIEAVLRTAVVGTLARDLDPSYSNIALMSAFLRGFAGHRFGETAWLDDGQRLVDGILRRFRASRALDEYNAPTYYGVDLYALGLWRKYGWSREVRQAGAELEAGLWREIARFYHAGLRNLAGPYDRSYGMDMRRYVATIALWIWLATGAHKAPLPNLDQPFEHAWDLGMAPVVSVVGVRIPADARRHLLAFSGPRRIRRAITAEPARTATAWLGPTVMIGAEDSGGTRPPKPQYHMATIHWLTSALEVGWIRLRHELPFDGTAEPGRLLLRCNRDRALEVAFSFEVSAPSVERAAIAEHQWCLPGLTVLVATDARLVGLRRWEDRVELRYSASVREGTLSVELSTAIEAQPPISR
jgi:hypothetical protein